MGHLIILFGSRFQSNEGLLVVSLGSSPILNRISCFFFCRILFFVPNLVISLFLHCCVYGVEDRAILRANPRIKVVSELRLPTP